MNYSNCPPNYTTRAVRVARPQNYTTRAVRVARPQNCTNSVARPHNCTTRAVRVARPQNCTTRAVRVARPLQQLRSGTETYQLCKQQPPDATKTQFESLAACQSASYCIGHNKAYSYQCAANEGDPVLVDGGEGQDTAALTNCYDCKNDACAFQANNVGALEYNTLNDCTIDDKKHCGWKYGCTA